MLVQTCVKALNKNKDESAIHTIRMNLNGEYSSYFENSWYLGSKSLILFYENYISISISWWIIIISTNILCDTSCIWIISRLPFTELFYQLHASALVIHILFNLIRLFQCSFSGAFLWLQFSIHFHLDAILSWTIIIHIELFSSRFRL